MNDHQILDNNIMIIRLRNNADNENRVSFVFGVFVSLWLGRYYLRSPFD